MIRSIVDQSPNQTSQKKKITKYKVGGERGDITTDFTVNKIRELDKQLHMYKLGNSVEMFIFPKYYKLSELILEEINSFNISIYNS